MDQDLFRGAEFGCHVRASVSGSRLAFSREDASEQFMVVFLPLESWMESARGVQRMIWLLNSSLALVGARLRLVGAVALGGKEILFPPSGPSFEALGALNKESMEASCGPLQPCEYRFVFERIPSQCVSDEEVQRRALDDLIESANDLANHHGGGNPAMAVRRAKDVRHTADVFLRLVPSAD
ncbi:MAG: hypothetical protein AAB463_02490 [Patescibacteria group bacterium]